MVNLSAYGVDRHADKTTIQIQILNFAEANGKEMGVGRARKIAQKIIRGRFDGEMRDFFGPADPTAEEAIANIEGREFKKRARSFVRPQEGK